MSEYTRIYHRFEYHEEDCHCEDCLYYQGKKAGCANDECCCEDIRAEAIANGRYKRPRGWFKRDS